MANLSNINNKFLVTTTGEVLVGRTAATGTSKLQVSGSLLIGTDINSGIPLVVQETTADGFAIGFMRNTNATNGNGLVIDVNSTGGAYIQDWRQASTVKMRLLQNGNLGIGTDSPGRELTVEGAGNVYIKIQSRTDNDSTALELQNTQHLWTIANDDTNNDALEFRSGGVGTPMVIEKGGDVGIGTTSPQRRLTVGDGSGSEIMSIYAGNTSSSAIHFTDTNTTTDYQGFVTYNHNLDALRFGTAEEERMHIDSSGNVGIGATPNDWDPTITALQIDAVSISAFLNNVMLIGGNAYYDDTANAYKYINDGFASQLTVNNSGNFEFKTAASGTAGGTVSLDTKVKILNNGNVGIGTSSPDSPLHLSQAAANTFFKMEAYASTQGADAGINVAREQVTGSESNLSFWTNTGSALTQKMAIDSSGTVIIQNNSTTTYGPTLRTVALTKSLWDVGDIVGEIDFYTSDLSGNAPYSAGFIQCQNTTGSGTLPSGALVFGTATYNAVGGAVERMRIGSNGFTTITTNGPGASLTISQGGSISINENVGYLNFYSNDVSTTSSGGVGGIGVYGETAFTGNTPSYMSFFTHANSANDGTVLGNATERMRITSGGNILFGTQGLPNGTSIYGSAFYKSTVDRMILRMATSITGAAGLIDFFNPNGQVGYIATNGTATQYVTSSDYRLKEDLQDFNGLDKVSKIPVYDFKWKTDESRSYGVMAHELQEVLPDAVSGEKDAEEMQGVDYSKIVPLLVKSIQELKAEVELLKNK